MIKVFNKSIRSVKDFERYRKYYGLRTQRKLTLEERYQERLKEQRRKENIMRYPLVDLTQKEFEEIPKAGDFKVDWLRNEAPFDFKFICKPNELVPGMVVMGHLVKGVEAICEQYGADLLSVPKKFINRYRVKIVS